MTLQEAQTLVLRVLKQVMEEKLDHHNVQLAQVCTCSTVLSHNDADLKSGYPNKRI